MQLENLLHAARRPGNFAIVCSADALMHLRLRVVASQLRCAAGSSSPSSRGLSVMAAEAAEIDQEYPGTAVGRMLAARERVSQLTAEQLSADWEEVRRSVLWAGGLKDITDAPPGQGYTGHAFNDWNHCDLTAMGGVVASNENNGQVAGIAMGNQVWPAPCTTATATSDHPAPASRKPAMIRFVLSGCVWRLPVLSSGQVSRRPRSPSSGRAALGQPASWAAGPSRLVTSPTSSECRDRGYSTGHPAEHFPKCTL